MAIARLIRPTNNFSLIPVKARNRLIWWTRRFAREIQRGIIADMASPKHGRWYWLPEQRRWHHASAPGEAPAIMTGALSRDLNPTYSSGGLRAVISPTVTSPSGAPYPTYLELGTSNMARRPYLQKGFNRFREAYKAKVRQIFQEANRL